MLTRKEAIEKHRIFWDGIYQYCQGQLKNPRSTRFDPYVTQRLVYKKMFPGREFLRYFHFLCEYVIENARDCYSCPLVWENGRCGPTGSEYEKFLNAVNFWEATQIAIKIRDLPEREE